MSIRTDLSRHDITEIERCKLDLERAALLVELDPIYLPIFARCQKELQKAEAKFAATPIERALALLAASRSG